MFAPVTLSIPKPYYLHNQPSSSSLSCWSKLHLLTHFQYLRFTFPISLPFFLEPTRTSLTPTELTFIGLKFCFHSITPWMLAHLHFSVPVNHVSETAQYQGCGTGTPKWNAVINNAISHVYLCLTSQSVSCEKGLLFDVPIKCWRIHTKCIIKHHRHLFLAVHFIPVCFSVLTFKDTLHCVMTVLCNLMVLIILHLY